MTPVEIAALAALVAARKSTLTYHAECARVRREWVAGGGADAEYLDHLDREALVAMRASSDALEVLNRAADALLKEHADEEPCLSCGHTLGHFVNCPAGVCFSANHAVPVRP